MYPIDVGAIAKERIVYLCDLKPERCEIGWGVFEEWKGQTHVLGATKFPKRPRCKKCILGHASSEIVYRLDGQYTHFLAVAGLYHPAPKSSVFFEVQVDGESKMRSELVGDGTYPFAVCVDIAGGRELKLVVADGGDGITNDCAVWGEARLVRKPAEGVK